MPSLYLSPRRSMFATLYLLGHYQGLLTTNHSILRKAGFIFYVLWNLISQILAFQQLASSYVIFAMITRNVESHDFNTSTSIDNMSYAFNSATMWACACRVAG